MAITYEKTGDPNIVKEVTEVKVDIHLDRLREEIADLEAMIADLPNAKTKPDQETLDYWNEMNDMAHAKSDMEAQLKEKQALLKTLEGIK